MCEEDRAEILRTYIPFQCTPDIQNNVILFQGSYDSPACPSDNSYINEKMNMKQ